MKKLLFLMLLCTMGLQAMTPEEQAEAVKLRRELQLKYGLLAGERFDTVVREQKNPDVAYAIVEKEYTKAQDQQQGAGVKRNWSEITKQIGRIAQDDSPGKTFYEQLGISSNSDLDTIRKAYKKEVVKAAKMKDGLRRTLLNNIKEILIDNPAQKAYYDNTFIIGGGAAGASGGGTWAGYGAGGASGGGASGASSARSEFERDLDQLFTLYKSTISKDPEFFTNVDLYNEWRPIVSSANALLSRWPATWNVGHGPHQELKNMRDIATVFDSLPSATPSQKKIMLDNAGAKNYFTKLVKGRTQVGRRIDQLIGSGQYIDAIAEMKALTPLTSAKIIATYIQQINGLKDRNMARALNQVVAAMEEYARLNQEINTIGIKLPKLQAEYQNLLRLDAQLKAQRDAERRAREEAERRAREQEERARQEARDAELARKLAQEEAERAKREQEAARRAQEEAARSPRPGAAGGGAAGAAGAADPYAGMSERDKRIAQRRARHGGAADVKEIHATIDEFIKQRGI